MADDGESDMVRSFSNDGRHLANILLCMTLHSDYKCPVCQQPLCKAFQLKEGGQSEVQLWCGAGRCPSQAANDGAEGSTEASAFDKLNELLAAEYRKEQNGPEN